MGTNGRFSDGFLLGALTGAAAFFLLGTEKGKKIIKAISEEGGPELSKFLKEFEKHNSGAKPEPKTGKPNDIKVEEKDDGQAPDSNGVKEEKPQKRFFKKSK